MDKFQIESLIILVVVTFGAEVFVIVAWHILWRNKLGLQAFGLVFLELLRTMMID